MKIILSCEHAFNRIPAKFQSLFVGADKVLASHRGWDPGSLGLGKTFSRVLSAPLFNAPASRLLVEPNRSIGHRNLFSAFTKRVDAETKQTILNRFYYPHRNAVAEWIAGRVAANETVLHLSLHTFVPVLDGQIRRGDVGLLYDPRRQRERELCERWRREVFRHRPQLKVRKNFPYLGTADGFTTFLRRQFPECQYLGVELEVNQRLLEPTNEWKKLAIMLANSLVSIGNETAVDSHPKR